MDHLIKDHIRLNEGTDVARTLKNKLKSSDQFPDDLVVELVRERLEKMDCKVNGWILDGSPTTFE